MGLELIENHSIVHTNNLVQLCMQKTRIEFMWLCWRSLHFMCGISINSIKWMSSCRKLHSLFCLCEQITLQNIDTTLVLGLAMEEFPNIQPMFYCETDFISSNSTTWLTTFCTSPYHINWIARRKNWTVVVIDNENNLTRYWLNHNWKKVERARVPHTKSITSELQLKRVTIGSFFLISARRERRVREKMTIYGGLIKLSDGIAGEFRFTSSLLHISFSSYS